jgi:hypothetical protein
MYHSNYIYFHLQGFLSAYGRANFWSQLSMCSLLGIHRPPTRHQRGPWNWCCHPTSPGKQAGSTQQRLQWGSTLQGDPSLWGALSIQAALRKGSFLLKFTLRSQEGHCEGSAAILVLLGNTPWWGSWYPVSFLRKEGPVSCLWGGWDPIVALHCLKLSRTSRSFHKCLTFYCSSSSSLAFIWMKSIPEIQ